MTSSSRLSSISSSGILELDEKFGDVELVCRERAVVRAVSCNSSELAIWYSRSYGAKNSVTATKCTLVRAVERGSQLYSIVAHANLNKQEMTISRAIPDINWIEGSDLKEAWSNPRARL